MKMKMQNAELKKVKAWKNVGLKRTKEILF
jgi:hypothetical protein